MSSTPPPSPSRSTLRTAVTASAGIALVWGLIAFVQHTLLAVTLTTVALMLAVALDHPVQWLVKRGWSRQLAIVVVTVCALGLLVATGFLLLPPVVDQAKALMADLPAMFRSARTTRLFHQLDLRFHIERRLLDFEQRLPTYLEDAAGPFFSVLSGLLTFVVAVLSVAILAIFMLVFGGRLVAAGIGELAVRYREHGQTIANKFYQSIGGYVGGLLLIGTINASFTITFLAILRIPFFLPLGLLSGFSSLVPYAGPLLMGATISLMALSTGGWVRGLATAIYFLAYGQLEGNVLGPLVFRRTVHVNPLVVTLSVLFFGEIAGVVGAVLAVPMAAVIQILVREYLRLKREDASPD